MAKQANRMMIGGFLVLAVIIMAASWLYSVRANSSRKPTNIFCTSMNPSRGWLWAQPVCSRRSGRVGDRHYSPSHLVSMKIQIPVLTKSSRTDWKVVTGERHPGCAAKLVEKACGPS